MQCELLGLPMLPLLLAATAAARDDEGETLIARTPAHSTAACVGVSSSGSVAATPEHAKDNQQQKRRQTVSRVTRLTTHVALVSPDRATSTQIILRLSFSPSFFSLFDLYTIIFFFVFFFLFIPLSVVVFH